MANLEQVNLLTTGGVKQWNKWREDNPNIEINFSHANLQNTNLDFVNLKNAQLDSTNLENSQLYNASLKAANLENANLKNVELDSSNLTSANLKNAILTFTELEYANLNNAELVAANLKNANLTSAELEYANLNNSNLNFANLENAKFYNADLSNGLLRVVTAIGTSFKNATLTGACIEDWHINNKTNFEDVICDYVYLKWDYENNKPTERRPADPSRNFEPGEFTKVFQIAHETVDLFFREGIDWQAFLSSYQNVQLESDHGELDIRAIEKSPDGSFVIRVDVPESTNKADLEAEFYERYEGELKRLEGVYQRKLQAKDREIESYRRESANMTEIAKLLANRPITVEAKAVAGDNIKQSGNFGIGHMSGGEIQSGAKVAGVYNEATEQNLAQAAADIKALIDQLEGDYESTPMGNMQMGTEIVSRISQNPTLKSRVINAIKEASVAAFEEAISHPVASIVIAGTKGFIEAE
ncbi:pentapeptide repeat protein [[Leptolyngbya] sp. PCC 7376]|uniref:pentapeptide repeat-containing protein n=1 Tax=[Leptolyngbya] sp. PCC 7376 TaxID=111781 RepID=UPI00029F1A5E|nr:pentapeptide repeat-containing protein [[Leptolyngbya] sp. PCC 7376]AFY39781.1 pentapeptide repeat protein [[Leptolyngbya] sp. PCC 7376]